MASNLCSCNFPLSWASERGTPLIYDRHFGEFRLRCRSGYKILSYCPVCGDRFPESRRPGVGAAALKEGERVRRILGDIRSRKDLIAKFGQPDEESHVGATLHEVSPKGRMPLKSRRRTMIYRNISKTFDVSFFVGQKKDTIAFDLQPRKSRF